MGFLNKLTNIVQVFSFQPANNSFDNIHGYDDVKGLVRRALDAEENYCLLFIGSPASGKTLFLQGILDITKDGLYFDATNTTNRLLDVLNEEKQDYLH